MKKSVKVCKRGENFVVLELVYKLDKAKTFTLLHLILKQRVYFDVSSV